MSPLPRRPIRRLDRATVERISAGEVVERPASVVKELVENAVDAGAGSVEVRLEDGGRTLVAVSDDGLGIPGGEVALAVERHATSKIEPDDALDAIASLGFRGEALAAIGTVSRLTLTSRPPDADEATRLEVVGGRAGRSAPAARAVGTTVEVRDLFYNVPARRKFLKSDAAEQVECVATVERLYLSRPDLTYRVRSATRELAVYPRATDLRDAAARVLGPALLRDSFEVEAPLPGGSVRGVLGRPVTATPTSRGLHFSVNGRSVVSKALSQSVRLAFGDSLPRSRFPVGVLQLDLSPGRVDVNVHPTKREVRIGREREVADALRLRVREALVAAAGPAELAEASTGSAARSARPASPASQGPDRLSRAPRRQSSLPLGSPERAVPSPPASTETPRLVGCVDSLYWIEESADGLVLVDQHAVSERVLYEALRRDGRLARQVLVAPVLVELTGAQAAALEEHTATVRAAGFDVESFGPGRVRVRSVPFYRGHRASSESLAELLAELAEGGRTTLPDDLQSRTAASVACHAALRAGDAVSPEEFRAVLVAWRSLAGTPTTCPHGRPISVRIPRSRLDRWFLRSGT